MADPKLKEAMAEISAILEKHDIAGQIVLLSKTHAEFKYRLDPSWSAITVGDGFLYIRAKKDELGSEEAVMEKAVLTAHILCQLRDLSSQGYAFSDKLIKELEKVYEIDHESFSGFEADSAKSPSSKGSCMKYNKEDLKIVAHECHSQGEFDTYNEAYDTLCRAYDNEGLSEGWLDFFFEKSSEGPVTVIYDREHKTWNCMAGERSYVLKALSEMSMENAKVNH